LYVKKDISKLFRVLRSR